VAPSGARHSGEELSVVITATRGWQLFDWSELLHYRDLLRFLVWRDVKTLYSQTVMGFGWAIIRPVFSMVIFTVVFGALAKVPSDGVPYALFSFVGLLPWTYYSTALTASANSLVNNTQMLTKVYFPRLIIPLTPVLAGLVDYAVALVFLAGLMFWYHVTPNISLLWAPLLVLLMVVTALGSGLWLSALSIQYRDIKHAITFISQLLMYATPVVWPASLIDRKFPATAALIRPVYGFFVPMAGVIEGFRASLLGTAPMPWDLIATGSVSAILTLLTGMLYFRRRERLFADVA
jgi:lipopolysaccharide transport system permease protein